jgi:hypothetical protein
MVSVHNTNPISPLTPTLRIWNLFLPVSFQSTVAIKIQVSPQKTTVGALLVALQLNNLLPDTLNRSRALRNLKHLNQDGKSNIATSHRSTLLTHARRLRNDHVIDAYDLIIHPKSMWVWIYDPYCKFCSHASQFWCYHQQRIKTNVDIVESILFLFDYLLCDCKIIYLFVNNT